MSRRGALTETERDYLKRRRAAGATLAMIATELQCAQETVRKWWRREQRGQPVPVRGRPRRGILSTYPPELVAQGVVLKQAHPHWGPANVVVALKRDPRFAAGPWPSPAQWSALFKARCPQAVQARHRQVYPAHPLPATRQAHQRWQVDGKEKIPVGQTEVATVVNIRDPFSAVIIASTAVVTTTPRGWRKLTLPEIQAILRTAMAAWGCPLEVQTDHEVVYTGAPQADFPALFTLWLVGLGLTHVPSRDRRPTDQAQVERTHRTLGDMGWKDTPSDQVTDLQALLDDCCERHNHDLSVQAADCHGRPPLVAHPEARHSGRPFSPAHEWELFDLTRVDAYLAERVWSRKVSATGGVSIGNHLYYVERAYAGQMVAVRFQAASRKFVFVAADGRLLAEAPAIGLDKVDLIGYMPVELAITQPWQLPLPWLGV